MAVFPGTDTPQPAGSPLLVGLGVPVGLNARNRPAPTALPRLGCPTLGCPTLGCPTLGCPTLG